MRSNNVSANTVAYPTDYNMLVQDASGAGRLLAHQMLGYFTLSTNPTNAKTLTLDINGSNVVITFVSSIGSTPGNVLIGATAAATCANLLSLLLNPTVTSATQVAIGVNTAANTTLVNYLGYALTGTTLVISSMNTLVSAPLTSFRGSTNATSDSYTAQTMALYVEPGVVYVNGTEIYFAGAVTPTVTAPSSHPRIDVLTIDNTGTLNWTIGSENVSPSAPTYPSNQIPICEVFNYTFYSETAIYDNANQQSGQGYILNDVTPFLAYPIPLGAAPTASFRRQPTLTISAAYLTVAISLCAGGLHQRCPACRPLRWHRRRRRIDRHERHNDHQCFKRSRPHKKLHQHLNHRDCIRSMHDERSQWIGFYSEVSRKCDPHVICYSDVGCERMRRIRRRRRW